MAGRRFAGTREESGSDSPAPQTNSLHAVSFAFPTLQRLCLELIARHPSLLPAGMDLSRFEATFKT